MAAKRTSLLDPNAALETSTRASAPILGAPDTTDKKIPIGQGPVTSIGDDEPSEWLDIPRSFLKKERAASFRLQPPFLLPEELRLALEIDDAQLQSFERASEEAFKVILNAEKTKAEAIMENGGIAYFRIPPLPEATKQFHDDWMVGISKIISENKAVILSEMATPQLDDLSRNERHLSIVENRNALFFTETTLRESNEISSYSFRNDTRAAEYRLKRYGHIDKLRPTMQPFFE